MKQVYFDDRLCYYFENRSGWFTMSTHDYLTDDFGNAVQMDNDMLAKQHIFLELR